MSKLTNSEPILDVPSFSKLGITNFIDKSGYGITFRFDEQALDDIKIREAVQSLRNTIVEHYKNRGVTINV